MSAVGSDLAAFLYFKASSNVFSIVFAALVGGSASRGAVSGINPWLGRSGDFALNSFRRHEIGVRGCAGELLQNLKVHGLNLRLGFTSLCVALIGVGLDEIGQVIFDSVSDDPLQ